MIKTYQALTFQEYHLTLKVRKQKTTVDFIGGSSAPVKVKGKFMTGDPDLQKALDQHPLNGKTFRMIKESKPEVIAPVDIKEGFTAVRGIRTFQDAKEWLANELEDISIETLNNKEKILMCAEANKINFTDLK